MPRQRRPRNPPRFPRTARLSELVREIVAEEIERIDDERLELVAITSVVVDADIHQGVVYYDALVGEEADEAVLEAFADHRVRLQRAIGQQTRLKRTPTLVFRADDVERGAARIEGILDELPRDGGDGPGGEAVDD